MAGSDDATESGQTASGHSVMVTRTDACNRIVFVNDEFLRASGYTADELLGQTHDLLRHPDMPDAVFADLGTTTRMGAPWEGLIKNRAKDGSAFWVRANVTPLRAGPAIDGYISVRTVPSVDDIGRAEAVYARLRHGAGGRLRMRAGRIEADTLGGRLGRGLCSFSLRLAFAFTALCLLLLLLGSIGLFGMRSARLALREVYEDRTVALVQMQVISNAVVDALFQLNELRDVRQDSVIRQRVAAIRRDLDQFDQQSQRLGAWLHSAPEQAALQAWRQEAAALDRTLVAPLLAMPDAGNAPTLSALPSADLHASYRKLAAAARAGPVGDRRGRPDL